MMFPEVLDKQLRKDMEVILVIVEKLPQPWVETGLVLQLKLISIHLINNIENFLFKDTLISNLQVSISAE